MTKHVRSTTALTTLLLMLLAQVAPAFDVCVCDASQPRACCTEKTKTMVEPSCCSSSEHRASQTESVGRATSGHDSVLSTSSCKRQTLSPEMQVVEHAAKSASHKIDTPQVPAVFAGQGPETGTAVPLVRALRAPPSAPRLPLFLLHASLLN